MSRATAASSKAACSLTPGSKTPQAAMEKLILPELGHLVKELSNNREA